MSGKKSRPKKIYFSWRKSIFKIWTENVLRKNIFRDQNVFQKKLPEKSIKNENSEIDFSRISKFSLFIDFSKEKVLETFWSRKYFSILFREMFDLNFINFCMDFSLYQSEIFPGIQKSYLEVSKTKLTDRKHKMPTFLCLLERSLGFQEPTLRTNSIHRYSRPT